MVEIIPVIALILLIWFDTDAFVEYAEILSTKFPKLKDKLFLPDYELVTQSNYISYPDFLVEYHNCFFTRLLSCPICVSTQLGLFFGLFVGLNKFAGIALSGLLLYKITKKLLA